jgi:hypothetical protein
MLGEKSFLAPTFETEIGLFQHTTALGQQGNFVARPELERSGNGQRGQETRLTHS